MLFGGFIGLIAGAVFSILVVCAAALATRSVAEPGAAAFLAWGVYGLAVVLLFAVASAAAFGLRRLVAQLSALPLVLIVLISTWLKRAPGAGAMSDPAQLFAVRLDATLFAALVWAVAGAMLARRLSRPRPAASDAQSSPTRTKGSTPT
jgi:hypothetical protein